MERRRASLRGSTFGGPRRLVAAAVLLGLLTAAPPAGAHALLRQSDPASGARLERGPQAVTLTFTEEPEPTLSSVHVLDASGRDVTQGIARPVRGEPEALRVLLGPLPLPTGVYTVAWRTVSRVDGHVTGGVFAFGVGVVPTAPAAPALQSPPPSLLGGIGRWLFYAGVSLLIGGAWVWAFALPALRLPAARRRRVLGLACAAAALGVVALGESQRADAGVALAAFMRTSLGWALVWREAPLLGVAVALAVGRGQSQTPGRPALLAVGALALLAVAAHVAAGHAAAAPPAWRWANVVVQWLHFSAVAAWIGGLVALLTTLPAVQDDRLGAVRRFSTAAGGLIAVVAATGVLRAVDEVGAWQRLPTTSYGQLVLAKAALLVVLGGLGAVNRYRHVGMVGRSLAGLRRAGVAEAAVAALTLAVTAVLTQTAPANFGANAAPAPLVVAAGADFGTSVRATLEVQPGFPGPNQFRLALRDYDTGRPLAADRVTLRFTPADRPGLGASTLSLARRADGAYGAEGANLSLEGTWNLVAVVERGVNSVEVPLTITVLSQPQRVRAIAAPGQPTVYSVDLPGGRVLDAYLDPGRPGFNEVHATYIDPAGRELSIPELVTITASRPAGTPVALQVRRFGPGHFIADATLPAGEWQLEIVAGTAQGEVLRTRLTVQLAR